MKYPALDKNVNLKIRQDLIDQDYLHKLSPKEKEWLNQFMKEYTNAALDTQNPKKNLHKTKALRKDCTDRNNKRNHDVYARAQARMQLEEETKGVKSLEGKSENPEDHLIELIDLQRIVNEGI